MIKIKKTNFSTDEPSQLSELLSEEKNVDLSVDLDDSNKKILNKISRICLYLIVFLTPLFFLPLTVAPIEINKQILIISLTLLASFSFFINVLSSRKIAFPKSLIAVGVLLLFLTFGISAIFSKARLFSFWGNFIQTDTFFNFLIFGLLFFLTANLFAVFNSSSLNRVKNRTYLRIFLVSLFLTTVIGLLQIFGKFILPWNFARQISFNTIGSLYSWAIFLAFGLVTVITILIGQENKTEESEKIKQKNKIELIRKITLSLLAVLILFCLFILNYQFIWLELALTMFFIAAYQFINKHLKLNWYLLLMTIFLCFTIISPFVLPLITLPTEVRLNLTNSLQIAVKAIEWKRLLIGTGPATFGFDYNLFKPAEINQTTFWQTRFNNGFNFLITSLATLGIFGVAAILFLIFSLIYKIFKTNIASNAVDKSFKKTPVNGSNGINLPIASGVFFLMINWFLFPSFFVQQVFIFLGLGVLASSSLKVFSFDYLNRNQALAVFLIISILASINLAGLFLIGQKYLSAIYYAKGLQTKDLPQSLSYLDKARIFNSSSDEYLRTLSQALILRLNDLSKNKSQENTLEIQNISILAIQFAKKATEINSADYLNWNNLAGVYESIIPLAAGAEQLAEDNYRQALKLDPKNPEALTNLARALLIFAGRIKSAQGETNIFKDKIIESKKVLEEAIKLKGDYSPAYFWLAQANLLENNLNQAIQLFKIVQNFDPQNETVKQIIETLEETSRNNK